jgi:molybdopterin/thiamine biosynthesis adenylyltransferase
MLYDRNAIYISKANQYTIKNYRILLAGCGIGSNIAECALRLGFENFTLIDGDKVELSNLNRQNYRQQDIGVDKTEALKDRLLSINSEANISVYNKFLTSSNIKEVLAGHDVAINALDFQSDVPLLFDELCQQNNIPVLHPYNIGWATLIFVIMAEGPNLTMLSENHQGFEKKVAGFLIEHIEGNTKKWVIKIVEEYEKGTGQSPPQLSVGSWLAAGVCTNILYRLATVKSVKQFPDFYFLTIEGY